MTHDQIARLSKSLEKNAARTNSTASKQRANRDCVEAGREISLGTILRRDRTYDRAF